RSLVSQSFGRTRWDSRFVPGTEALFRYKRAVGRAQDLADFDTLTSWDSGFADYFSASDLRPNQRLFFGCGSSGGAGTSAGVSSFFAGSSTVGSSRVASVSVALTSASLRFDFFSGAGFSSTTFSTSTHSMNAMGAESLLRWPSFTTRVYPPLRSADLGAMSSNNFLTAFFWRSVAKAVRRA